MDFGMIFSILQKGLQLIPILIDAGKEVKPIINNLVQLTQDAKEGTVTEDQLTTLEASLDGMIEEFNEPMS